MLFKDRCLLLAGRNPHREALAMIEFALTFTTGTAGDSQRCLCSSDSCSQPTGEQGAMLQIVSTWIFLLPAGRSTGSDCQQPRKGRKRRCPEVYERCLMCNLHASRMKYEFHSVKHLMNFAGRAMGCSAFSGCPWTPVKSLAVYCLTASFEF